MKVGQFRSDESWSGNSQSPALSPPTHSIICVLQPLLYKGLHLQIADSGRDWIFQTASA